MTSKHCLNCGKEVSDKYCSGCGQKTDTHRISFKNFIFHDVLHGTFHLERGIFFTAKESLLRPGKAALDYIAGKRKRYYNVFLLILITIGLMLFFRHLYAEILVSQGRLVVEEPNYVNEANRKMNEIISQKAKIVILLFVPLAAINSFILFRRKKLNLSEHSIIAGMILLGVLLLSLFGNILFYINLVTEWSSSTSSIISLLITLLTFVYTAYGYINAFGKDYKFLGISYRITLFFVMIFAEIFVLFLLTFGFLTDWQFGEIQLSL